MSDIMKGISFEKLIRQSLEEYRRKETIFDVRKIVHAKDEKMISFCGGNLENPLGVAAGPHTQLAQNLIACYVGGARLLELKTVQKMYGEELGIPRPCIRANDEGYNVEWSSEFSPKEAMEEYIKAWVATKVLAKEFAFGNPDGFEYNMSVGYNLEGISSPSVNAFLDGLHDASQTECFKECKAFLLEHLDWFENVDADFVEGIDPHIATSVSLSTMHGCPAEEIERIATYLLEEKGFNTFVKCNPTLLGYDYVRGILDDMGYDYLDIDPHQFEVDLKFDQGVAMIKNLIAKGKELGRVFGVKLSNTMPVGIHHKELPGDTMYMSGKSLYPLTISLARVLTEAIGPELEISYSGGADKNNIKEIFEAGIYPITVCTTLLQPLGYDKLEGLYNQLQAVDYPTKRHVVLKKLEALVEDVRSNKSYCKSEAQRKKTDAHIDYAGVSDKESLACTRLCKSCMYVCPNRANTILETKSGSWILHIDDSCNECGNCQFFCIQPCHPYRDRFTLFSSVDMMNASENKGIVFDGIYYYVRLEDGVERYEYSQLPEFAKEIVDAIIDTHAYLID